MTMWVPEYFHTWNLLNWVYLDLLLSEIFECFINKLALIIEYFNVYALRSKKHFAFAKWKVIYNYVLNKEHLTPEGSLADPKDKENLKELSKLINKDND